MDRIRVVDVPHGTSAVEAQRLLNEPSSENAYMLVQVLQLANGTIRAFYRLLSKVISGNSNGPKKDADGKEQAANEIIQNCLAENKKVTADTIVAKLADAGIVRSLTWVKIRPAWKTRHTAGCGTQEHAADDERAKELVREVLDLPDRKIESLLQERLGIKRSYKTIQRWKKELNVTT